MVANTVENMVEILVQTLVVNTVRIMWLVDTEAYVGGKCIVDVVLICCMVVSAV